MSRSALIPLVIFVCAASILCRAVFYKIGNWGIDDWDQHLFYHAVPRDTILRYHQFPLWNPYYCGGNVMLANPQARFLSPFFLLHLPFGTVIGIKLEIWLHVVIAMFGMFLLSKQMGLTRFSAYLPPLLFALSTPYAMHLTEGHTWFMAFAYMPYVVFFYLKSRERFLYALAGSAFIALMILEGGTYPTPYTLLLLGFYSVCLALRRRTLSPLISLGVMVGMGFLLSAVKLLPTLSFLHHHPRPTGMNDHLSFSLLPRIFLNRMRSGTPRYGDTRWEWHEYSTYMGVVPLMLLTLGVISSIRRRRGFPLLITTLLFLLLAFGEFHPLAPWSLLHRLPFFSSMRVPSRFLVVFLFGSALIAGKGFSWVERYLLSGKLGWKVGSLICLGLLFLIGSDLILVSSKAFFEAFPYPPKHPVRREEFRQIKGSNHAMLEAFLRNEGTIDGYEPVHLPIKAIPSDDPRYRGEVFLKDGEGKVEIAFWSPNRIEIIADITHKGYLCVNQNFDPGWRVKGGGEVIPLGGIIATKVDRGRRQIVFYYLPTSFLIGAFLSFLGVGISLIPLATRRFWI